MSTNQFQNKKSGNGKPANEPEKLQYPVTFELKVVFETILAEAKLQANTDDVLVKNRVSYTYLSSNLSAKGTYISLTYKVTIISQSQLNQLYDGLKSLPGIKFAL